MPHDAASNTGYGLKTAVLLCQDLEGLGHGLTLGELRSFLQARFPSVTVEIVPHLCQEPGLFSRAIALQSVDRAVLGLCSGDYPEIEMQAQARKAGLDPFGVEVVPLGTLCAGEHPRPQVTHKAKVLLAAAVARAQAYRKSRPEQAKPYFLPWDQGISRRSLFTLPPIGYRPVPGFTEQRCTAGCQLCVKACPRDALSKEGGQVLLDKTRCEGCGVCLATCPHEAVDLPGWSLPQFEAQISALLDPAARGTGPVALLLICQRALPQMEEMEGQGVSCSLRWLPVAVPCLGMVTPAWVLQALAHGAAEVALLMCGQSCPFGQQEAIRGRADFCRQFLDLMGQPPERVRALSTADPGGLSRALQTHPSQGKPACPPHQDGERLRLEATQGAHVAIRCLAGGGAVPPGMVLEHPYSPFGILGMRTEGCTGCVACVEACPTGALASERSGDSMVLTFAASLCNGCGMCVDICPETAAPVLAVRKATDLDALSRGRVMLHQEQMATCEGCGEAFASQAMLRRIGAQVGGSDTALYAALSRYCPSCRTALALGTRPGA